MTNTLARGWAKVRLDALVDISSGVGFPPALQGRSTGDYPLAKVGDVSRAVRDGDGTVGDAVHWVDEADLRTLRAKPFPSGSILFAKIGESIRQNFRAITTRPLVVDNNVMALVPRSEAVHPSYLLHFVRTQDWYPLAVATTVPSLRKTDLAASEVPLPPLNEQRRIVAKLEALQARSRRAREALDAVPPLLEKLRQSILAAAFRGDLTKDWRAKHKDVEPASELLKRIRAERKNKWEEAELAKMKAKGKAPTDDKWKAKYKEPEPVDTSGLPELPRGWCWASLVEMAVLVTSGSRGWAEYYSDTGPLFIRSQDINTDSLSLHEVAHVQLPASSEGVRTRVQQFDLLVTITGANVTRCASVSEAPGEAYVSQHVALVRPVSADSTPYLHLWLVSETGGRKQLKHAAYGLGKPGLSLDDVATVVVPLAPADEQIELIRRTTDLRRLATNTQVIARAQLVRVGHLERATLAKAFSGQLVPQDPNDEPAEVMLERSGAGKDEARAPQPAAKKAAAKRGARA